MAVLKTSSFVTASVGVFGAGLVRVTAFLGREGAPIPQVHPGIVSRAALSVNGGCWDPTPEPKGGASGCEFVGESDRAGQCVSNLATCKEENWYHRCPLDVQQWSGR